MKIAKCFVFFFYLFTFLQADALSKTIYPLSSDPIDVVIPCSPKDIYTLEPCIRSIRKFGKNIRHIFVVSKEPLTSSAEWFNEKNYPFSKEDIALELFHQDITEAKKFIHHPATRIGWMYQQLLKLYAPFIIPGISPNVLVLDADVIWLAPIEFMTNDGEPYFTTGIEYHPPYFEHISRLLPGLKRIYSEYSGIAHHMLFQRPILKDLLNTIETQHQTEAWKALCRCVDHQYVFQSSFSEYEIYFNFTLKRTDQAHLRSIKWNNDCKSLKDVGKYQSQGYVFVACHEWFRQ